VLAALRPALLEGDGGWLLGGGDPSAMPPWWREGLARTHFRLGGGSLRGPGRYQELVGCAQLRALAAFQALAERHGAPGEGAGGEGAGGPAPPDLGRLWVSDHRAFLEFVADPESAAEGVARALEGLAARAGQWWERAPRLAECADAVRSLGLGFGFGAKPGPRGCEVEALARRLRDPFHCSLLSDAEAQAAADLLREALRAARFLAAGPAGGGGGAAEGAAGEGAAGEGAAGEGAAGEGTAGEGVA
jgi:hypothetical protein